MSTGSHTIKIFSTTGTATGSFTVVNASTGGSGGSGSGTGAGTLQSPKTFDAGLTLYAGMALTSAAGALYVTHKRKED